MVVIALKTAVIGGTGEQKGRGVVESRVRRAQGRLAVLSNSSSCLALMPFGVAVLTGTFYD